jgi:hypothetical protein
MMGPLQLGMTLLQKYRIERFRLESHGVFLYEATDTAHARRVCIKVLRREFLANTEAFDRFQDEMHGASVIDIGTDRGLPYLVATQWQRNRPPPLPARPRPTLLPPARTVFERRRSVPWRWVAALVVAGFVGAGGGYMVSQVSSVPAIVIDP